MKLRSPLLIRLAAFALAGAIRTWMSTVRATVVACDGQPHPADPTVRRFVYAFWHESLLAPTRFRTNIKVLVSQSNDGELIATVCKHLGFGTVRGSSNRGGASGLLNLLRTDDGCHLGITPDGPRGPRRQVKGGAVFLASHAGVPLVPVGVGFTGVWRARSWDRFALPKPGSAMTGVVGLPVLIPPDLDREGLEHYRREIERAMLAATAAAERWADDLSRPPNLDELAAPRRPACPPARLPIVRNA